MAAFQTPEARPPHTLPNGSSERLYLQRRLARFGLFFAGAIAGPLLRLRDGVKEIGEGNFAVAVPEKRAREVAELAHAFNDLGAQLTDYIAKRDFIRDTFGRDVTQEVVKGLLESKEALELGGETRESPSS